LGVGRKVDDLALQKKKKLGNPKKLKPDANWKNLLRKAIGSKCTVSSMMMMVILVMRRQRIGVLNILCIYF
jgi:hypothetical protein